MPKRIAAAVILLTFVAATALAASAAPVKGTVASSDGNKVQITLVGEKADWVKEGPASSSITFNTKKASELKVGEEISLAKGPAAMVGC